MAEIMNISPEVQALLESKKIYFTFAYYDELRFYKHNQLIWQKSDSDVDVLLKEGRKCIDFFVKNGYIPNAKIV